jgi:poly(A) polymerase
VEAYQLDTHTLHLLHRTAEYFNDQRQPAYLVGGSLRNILLGQQCVDWDIVTTGDAHRLARRLADKLGAYYVHLHEKASRVVVVLDTDSPNNPKQEITFDISPLNGKTIEDDLRQRDFTINAIAAPLGDIVRYLEMHDTGQPPGSPPRGIVGATLAVALAADPLATGPTDATLATASTDTTLALGPMVAPDTIDPLYALPDPLAPGSTDATLTLGPLIAPDTINPLHVPPDPLATGSTDATLATGPMVAPDTIDPLHALPDPLATGAGAGSGLNLIDPLHGLADLAAHRLKAVNEEVFRRDPLRMLRAVRLMMRYGLEIDRWTEELMIRDAALLTQVAAERVHDELYALLGPAGATERLRFLDEHGLFTVIFPEFVVARGMRQPGPHYWDVLEHSLESVGALERVARMVEQGSESTGRDDDLAEIRVLLREAETQGIFSFERLKAPGMKMAALLHDIGKTVTYSEDGDGGIHFYNHPQAGVPLVEQVLRRLCASTQDRRLAQLVSAHHMRPGQLGQDGPVTPRAIRRYFVDLGPAGIYVALISLADHLATLGPQPVTNSWERHLGVVRLLLESYIRERERILPPRLISPEELIRRLNLEPGPLIGQLLDLIAEAQAEGTIHSKEEALWLAEERMK